MSINKRNQIALIGSYPPPYGGISVHIQRMKNQLEKQGYKCVVYNLGKQFSVTRNVVNVKHIRIWLLKYAFFAREDIIHFHNSDWRIRVLAGLMTLLGKKVIISIHGASLKDSLKKGNWVKRLIIKFALKSSSFIIVDNSDIKKIVLSCGVKLGHVEIVSPFIPPVIHSNDYEKIPSYIWMFYNSHKIIMYAMARVVFYNNMDLYGLDMMISLMKKLKKYGYMNIGLVIKVPECKIEQQEYFKGIKKKIVDNLLENDILIIEEDLKELYLLEKEADFMIRPSCTDGDSVSIRESLYFDIPVVTSDAIPRPIGCIIFKNRNLEDFAKKVIVTIKKVQSGEKVNIPAQENNIEKIIKIYKKVLNS